jgi:hypothetical protein
MPKVRRNQPRACFETRLGFAEALLSMTDVLCGTPPNPSS